MNEAASLSRPGQSGATMDDYSEDSTGTPHDHTAWTRACQRAVAGGDALELTLYTRSAVPAYGTRAYHDEVRARLAGLATDGSVADWHREVLGERLDPEVGSGTEGGPGDAVRAETDVADLLAWADRRGLALPFQERRRRSMLVEESHAVLVPPHVLLAVRSADDVLGVAPCRDGAETTTVMDLLTLLEDPEPRGEDRPTATA